MKPTKIALNALAMARDPPETVGCDGLRSKQLQTVFPDIGYSHIFSGKTMAWQFRDDGERDFLFGSHNRSSVRQTQTDRNMHLVGKLDVFNSNAASAIDEDVSISTD